MDRIGQYEMKPFSKARENILLVSHEGKQRNNVYALLEVDVTTARQLIHNAKGSSDISFTGWIIKCVAQAANEHRQLNTYRLGRRKIVEFEDVDIPIPIEREDGTETRPMAYIIRKANQKTVQQITQEIRQVQHQEVNSSTNVLGSDLSRGEQWMIHAPLFIKKFGLLLVRRRGLLKKKHLGTIGVTSVGMKGRFPGWIIPLGGPVATLIAVGGISKKPGVNDREITVREYLHLTVTVDHAVVDGGPLARFVDHLVALLEEGFGLPKS